MNISFKLEKKQDKAGQLVDTIVKYIDNKEDEEWCTIPDLDRLFDSCVSRWGSNWDLNKLVTCVNECEFD